MKECPECNAENPIAASFCRHCRYKFDRISKEGRKIKPRIKDFRVTELYCVEGVPFDIIWEVENCTRLLFNGIEIPLNLNNKRETISTTTTFTLIAENEYQIDEKIIIITPLPKPRIISFDAARLKLKVGDKTTLKWKTDNATELTIRYENTLIDVSTVNELTVSPEKSAKYTLLAYLTGNKIQVEQELSVSVFDKIEIIQFKADKNKIMESECVRLQWNIKNADRITLYPINKKVGPQGYIDVYPRMDTNYYLQAENDFFSERYDVSVFVTQLPKFNTNLIPKLELNGIPAMDVDLSVKPPVRDIQKLNHVHSVLSETEVELYAPLVNIFSNLYDSLKKWKINI